MHLFPEKSCISTEGIKFNKKNWWDIYTSKTGKYLRCPACWAAVKKQNYSIHIRKHNYFGYNNIKEWKNSLYEQLLDSKRKQDIMYWDMNKDSCVIFSNEKYDILNNVFLYDWIENGVLVKNPFFLWTNYLIEINEMPKYYDINEANE